MKKTFVLLALSLCTASVFGHAVVYDDPGMAGNSWYFILLGIKHIIPSGFDHLLFMTGIFLSTRKLDRLIRLASAFTVAHSITLILCSTGMLPSRPALIEPVIGLTIAMVGIQNMLAKNDVKTSYLIVFVFGLIHGCGFASALGETGIPEKYFYSSLVCFNVGIEIAQILVLGVLYLATRHFTSQTRYENIVARPLSIFIVVAGIFMTVGRLYF